VGRYQARLTHGTIERLDSVMVFSKRQARIWFIEATGATDVQAREWITHEGILDIELRDLIEEFGSSE